MNNPIKKSSVYLQLNTQNTPDKKPNFSVRLNTVEQQPNNVHDHTYCYDMIGVFGENQLTIELTNKDPQDTQVDIHGKIVHDLFVDFDQMLVDQIDITSHMKQRANYIIQDGTQEYTNGFMHKNGVLTLNFVCPGFYFFKKLKFI